MDLVGKVKPSRSRGKKGIIVTEDPPVFTEIPPVPPISLASAASAAPTALPPRRSGRSGRGAVKGSSPPPTPTLTLAPKIRGKRKNAAEIEEKNLKEQFLKEQHEEAEAKIRFLREVKIEKEKLESESEKKRESTMSASFKQHSKQHFMQDIVKRVIAEQKKAKEEIKKLKQQERILEQEEIEKQNISLRQEQERIFKQKKIRQENVEIITRGIQDRQERLVGVESIPAFTEYSYKQIQDFVKKQFPPDTLSILDNLSRLTLEARKEIVEFIVLKFKAVTLNTIVALPGAIDDRYNQLGIKSLPLPAFERIPTIDGMRSSAIALMVCEIAPRRVPAEWCCCVGSDDRDFGDIAQILRDQDSPFVTAHPGIQSMIGECSSAVASSAVAASAFAAAAAGPGGGDPEGFDDPFPSVIIGDERIVYSIGPIIDDEVLFGRPLIMIRIHNYKTDEYPNGIYFWTYPSFSEGGTARAFLTIGGKKFMKGPDYTLTTFILDLLQVHINKYYVKHFVSKQGSGNYHPTTLSNQQEIVCFFGGMIHLQTKWVHDLIAGTGEFTLHPGDGLRLGKDKKTDPPNNFNRHCYRFNKALPMDLWVTKGITDVESYNYTYEAAMLATQFRKDNNLYSCNILQGQRVYSSFPLSCCLTTLFHKYREKSGNKSDVNDFFQLFKKWPETLFVQGCSVVPGVSPVVCIVAGSASNIAGMKYNPFVDRLSTSEFAKKMTSLRLVEPISTIDTGVSFSTPPMLGRNDESLQRQYSFPGSRVVVDVKEVNPIELNTQVIASKIMDRGGFGMNDEDKNKLIFSMLPRALRETIYKIFDIINPRSRLVSNPRSRLVGTELEKIRKCFKLFLKNRAQDIYTLQHLINHIIGMSFNYMPDGSNILLIRDSPLYRLVRTLESGVYRHLLMSGILNEYTQVSSFPLDIPRNFEPELDPQVRCAFLNEHGQYVEVPGGLDFGAGSGGNCDFSGIFQHPLFRPYIFSATRKSMMFRSGILDIYIEDPGRVNPHVAHADATIPVKVHNKMFLLRLIFYTKVGAIQVVVCISSSICIASPVGGAPYIPFGVDVQFNVVSIGPLGLAQSEPGDRAVPEGLSAFATILATMSDYLSLGCMAAAKKGEYSKTAGYQQFLDYLDNYFRTIMTECFTYVSAYMSPFNSGKDLVMKHFGNVFDNFGDNDISTRIREMWDWWGYLQHVQEEVCSKNNGVDGLITPDMIEEAITSGRRNMQIVVQTLFDPILGQLDAREFGEFTGEVGSEVDSEVGRDDGSMSTSGRSDSGSSSGSDRSRKLVRRVFSNTTLTTGTDTDSSWPGSSMDSRESQGSASSPEPLFTGQGPAILMDSNGGSTIRRTNKNKKTRKYIGNRKNKTKSKRKMNAIRRIINGNRRTRKNTQVSKIKTKTMKIKSKKFPKRIYLYSTPRTAQRMAYKYLGRIKTAKLYPARNPAKKYMVFDPKNNKWVNFGQMGYEDYTKHHDKTRRKNYLTRTKGMLGDWKSNKYSANNLSRNILW